MRQRRPPGLKPGNLRVVSSRAVTKTGGTRRAGFGIKMSNFQIFFCLCVRAYYIPTFF